ncbi:DNA cross-link repair protein pso2/snm1 [Escovopsis weberi]|uniref:DNA cross-link repair protein pso2/snm1 n=1 Tax=Escovopsis weberi TaxID=150374 RepID=A0A0M8MU54_ESCWE|nr:DNA cross-link repair protein pso2/snm1 [Escovopsis weberi]
MATSAKLNRSSVPKKPAATNLAKSRPSKFAKPNASILNFFQKAPKPEDSLFVGAGIEEPSVAAPPKPPPEGRDVDGQLDKNKTESRFNEMETPNKKRRLSVEEGTSDSLEAVKVKVALHSTCTAGSETPPTGHKPRPKIKGPFVIDSESEDEGQEDDVKDGPDQVLDAAKTDKKVDEAPPPTTDSEVAQSAVVSAEEDINGFEGEEMREMRFMKEQARLEACEAAALSGEDLIDDVLDDESPIESCPICNGTLRGLSDSDAARHVNGCLDGDPIPLPAIDGDNEVDDAPTIVEAAEISKRFTRAAVPRPGQPNPFAIDNKPNSVTSAFSKLMSGNAEDSAWASAAAAESASRGRPAYERTCPFYKIIPGFSICVDAFRYGAVEGCEAYFLSHFHSDHYIGLTANWRHGPIYCSAITGGLVKQQLRTAAKWVVELEFEKQYDIPGTDGATVTMMPANHCPGSSLFLFEKQFESGSNRKTKRILHCGDFRACPEHVSHPLLKPDVLDSMTGKLRPQRIDLCYLDTTYLNPRYSFPPQGDVIKACAELCRSMSPDPNSRDDISSHLRSERKGQNDFMSNYFHSVGEPSDRGSRQGQGQTEATKPKARQRLLVVCGTYSIGKERICVAIAKGLKSKIFASPAKIRICQRLNDPELSALLTADPTEAQVHMQMLMEIRAETLQDYLDSYKPHFSRIVGFRPSGWNFRHATGKPVSPNTPPGTLDMKKILHGPGWRTRFGRDDLVWQRGSTREAMCFGVPYSEHSSFRELAMFVMSLRIEKVVPTVNVGSQQSRKRMKGWIDKWMMERRKGGLVRPLVEGEDDEAASEALWGSRKPGTGGGAWW